MRNVTHALTTLLFMVAFGCSLQPGKPGLAPARHEQEWSIEDLGRQFQLVAKAAAPYTEVAPGAQESARAQMAGMAHHASTWTQVGNAPLFANDPAEGDLIDGTNFLGWVKLSARVTSFTSDPSTGRVFLSNAGGGVWMSTDGGNHWSSIGDALPTQVVGAIAYTPYGGGKLVAGTGDPAMAGGLSLSGLGVYATKNMKSWNQSSGIPSGALTFRIAVDPSDPTGATLYAATSKGLFRSQDGGGSFTNVALPTTPASYPINCAGDTTTPQCFFANIVTDVAVRPADATGLGGGRVIAAVGWVGGQIALRQADGSLSSTLVQSPQNGIYVSSNGQPGTFRFVNPGSGLTSNGFAPTPVVGRTALSIARGAGQNHDIVYAIVQDAQKISACLDDAQAGLDLGTCLTGTATAPPTVLDGAYVSKDFGKTWTKIMDWTQLELPGTNSALGPVGAALGYAPGVQSWYNLWIEADPTATDAPTGAPTRVAFGLEEVWENGAFGQPVLGPATTPVPWHVIGRYWNACAFSVPDAQCNAAASPFPGTTTHPDQHAAMFVPDGSGGVTLFVGNDGGAYQQHVAAGGDFSNDGWAAGVNDGIHALLPYDVAVANDGTIVAGLQDNGEMKITPTGYQSMIFGGDGFFTAIDPANSKNIVEEYAGGVVSISLDGGTTWSHVNPGLTSPLFATPFVQDPTAAGHVMIGGREVMEVTNAYQQAQTCTRVNTPVEETCAGFNWTTVFDLGTADHPGDASASSSSTDPNNRLSAVDLRGNAAYVGYCGPCSGTGAHRFGRGIATNVGGTWHVIADPAGLPKRYITSIQMDTTNPNTVYVTLGGYSTHWVPPGAIFDESVGTGHVFKSTDGGNSFTDISGNLPDTPADWVAIHGNTLIVGTDIGVFISGSTDGGTYQVVGNLPAVPAVAMTFAPNNPNLLYVATYGRGIWSTLLQ